MERKECVVLIAVVLCFAATALAQAPSLISYQGRIVTSEGVPLASGTYDMDFIVYDAQSAGTARYTEQHRVADAVAVTGGLFSVQLGGITVFAADLFQAYPELWLEVVLDPTGTPETFSRVRLVSAPFALEAKHLEGVNATASQLNELVGGGVTSLHSHPGAAHTHFGAVWSGANAGASGLSVTNTDTGVSASGLQGIAGAPQVGIANPASSGVRGESSTTFGVLGMSDALPGVWGSTFAANPYLGGVMGASGGAGGTGVFGLSTLGNGMIGWSNDTAGAGANAMNGVVGLTNSTDPLEAGVYGMGAAACGVIGVSTDGYGVYGESTGLDGVRGVSTGAGIADNGVYGMTNSTSSGDAGVYGYNSGSGYGGRFVSANYRGLYASGASGQYAAYFAGDTGVFSNAGYLWTAQTNYYSVQCTALSPREDGYSFFSGAYILNYDAGTQYWGTSVQLPNGATVTRVRLYVYDTVAEDLQVELRQIDPTNDVQVIMASVTVSGSGGFMNASDTTISSATIDNASYSYFLWLTFPGGNGTNLRFNRVEIRYTTEGPD